MAESQSVIKIFHLEDESGKNSYAPRSLLLRLRREGGNHGLTDVDTDEHGETVFTADFLLGGRQHRIEYEMCETREALRQKMTPQIEQPEGVGLLILDYLIARQQVGCEVYNEFVQKIGSDRIIFITSYPGDVARELGWQQPDARLIEKTLNRTELSLAMLDHLLRVIKIKGK